MCLHSLCGMCVTSCGLMSECAEKKTALQHSALHAVTTDAAFSILSKRKNSFRSQFILLALNTEFSTFDSPCFVGFHAAQSLAL